MSLPKPKRVPFHEPDPDRFAKSEQLRLQVARAEARRAAMSEGYTEEIRHRPQVRSAGRRAVPIVENPDTSVCCPPEQAQVKGQRGDRVLYYPTVMVAELAFGGTRSAARIKNTLAPSGKQKDPYGWKWTLLIDRRSGRRVAQP